MRYWLIAILAVSLLSANPAFSDDFFPSGPPRWTIENPGMYLHKGQPAPDDGAFFSGPALIELAEKLRDAKIANDKIDFLLKEIEFKDKQITELIESRNLAVEALTKANEIIKDSQLIGENREKITSEYKQLIAQMQKQNKDLEDKLQKAENKTWWERLWMGFLIVGLTVLGIAF
jgi:hypothetical protein